MPTGKKIGCGCLILFFLLVAALIPAVRSARESARRMQCVCHCKQLGLALLNYHDQYHCFPPAYTVDADGKPLHSWRVLILPFIEQQNLYDKIRLDEPWDSEHNQQFHVMQSSYLRCPSGPGYKPSIYTSYLRIIGPGTLTRGPDTVSLKEIADPGSTIMFVESLRPVCWMAPEDISIDEIAETITCDPDKPDAALNSRHFGIVHVTTVDDSVINIRDDTPGFLIQRAAKIK